VTKALTRTEAENYLLKYITEGYTAMLEACTDHELVDVFEATTGQALILPAVEQGRITDVSGNKLSSGPASSATVGTTEPLRTGPGELADDDGEEGAGTEG